MTIRCEICEVKPAKYRCSLCGRLVCDTHFNLERSICKICEMSLCDLCGKTLAISCCPICGRLGCSDCLTQLTPVIRVCKECLAKYGIDYIKRILKLK